MNTPFIPELNTSDNNILHLMRVERFHSNLHKPEWYGVKARGSNLQILALNPLAATFAKESFINLAEIASIVLGVKSISLFYAAQQIAAYTRGKEVLLENENMQGTLEKEQVATSTSQALSISTNAEYISLPQLREMAMALSGDNEEFIGWMESAELSIPMRFISGAPYFQKKAIAKAVEQWNNSKIQGVVSRFLGMPASKNEPAANGTATTVANHTASSEGLKNLRTPPGFKPVKTGKDKYAKTVAALAEKINPAKWGEYLTHITDLDSIGEPFVKRLAQNYSDTNAYAKLHEAFMEYAKSGAGAIAA